MQQIILTKKMINIRLIIFLLLLLRFFGVYTQVDMREVEKLKEKTQQMRNKANQKNEINNANKVKSEYNYSENSIKVDYLLVLKNPEKYLNKDIKMINILPGNEFVDRKERSFSNEFKKYDIKKDQKDFFYNVFFPYLMKDKNRCRIIYQSTRPYNNRPQLHHLNQTNKRGVLRKKDICIDYDNIADIEKYCKVKVDSNYYVFEDYDLAIYPSTAYKIDKLEDDFIGKEGFAFLKKLGLFLLCSFGALSLFTFIKKLKN